MNSNKRDRLTNPIARIDNIVLASGLIELWKEYRRSKKGREASVPNGLPVFNATNFIYWLVEKYDSR